MRGSAGLAFAVTIAGAASAHGADYDRTYRFEVEWGPAPLAELSVRRVEDGGTLRLEGQGRSVGFVTLFADFEFRSVADYDAAGPQLVRTDAVVDGERASRTVRFDPNGLPVVETTADPDPDRPRTPIPEGELADVVDPAWPVIDTLERLDDGGTCGGEYRVFSGTARFDVTMSHVGPETLKADRDWTYGGEAVLCRMRIERVGGFFEEPRYWRQEEADVTRDFWFAKLDDGRHGPVRFRVSWPLGYATARIDLRAR